MGRKLIFMNISLFWIILFLPCFSKSLFLPPSRGRYWPKYLPLSYIAVCFTIHCMMSRASLTSDNLKFSNKYSTPVINWTSSTISSTIPFGNGSTSKKFMTTGSGFQSSMICLRSQRNWGRFIAALRTIIWAGSIADILLHISGIDDSVEIIVHTEQQCVCGTTGKPKCPTSCDLRQSSDLQYRLISSLMWLMLAPISALCQINTAFACLWLRPARPICCMYVSIVEGGPICTTVSTYGISTPIPRADVAKSTRKLLWSLIISRRMSFFISSVCDLWNWLNNLLEGSSTMPTYCSSSKIFAKILYASPHNLKRVIHTLSL